MLKETTETNPAVINEKKPSCQEKYVGGWRYGTVIY
jgi:hypothetical protein